MRRRRIGEFELIARYFAPLANEFPGAFKLRDDAAVIAPSAGHERVMTADALIDGVHFLPDDPPDLVARKALRVNLSDLAAKGARPRAYLLVVCFPRTVTEPWIASFARGLTKDQREFAIHLAGGDTCASAGPWEKAMKAAETTWQRRKFLLMLYGWRWRKVQRKMTMKVKPTSTPRSGERIRARTIFRSPAQCSSEEPAWAKTAPMSPPMMAWEEEAGRP